MRFAVVRCMSPKSAGCPHFAPTAFGVTIRRGADPSQRRNAGPVPDSDVLLLDNGPMGMFDWYEPDPPLCCPVCSVRLEGWQGKDSDCGLLVWREGFAYPVSQDLGESSVFGVSADELKILRLPDTFKIYTNSCGKHWIDIEGRTEEGTWVTSEIRRVAAVALT